MKKNKEMNEGELTPKEAEGLLEVHLEGKTKRVHTFDGFGSMLMGCDIDLSDLKKRFKTAEYLGLAGVNMTGMGHGVAIQEKGKRPLFLATDKKKLEAIYKKRKITME
jgi:hypothetical protein